MKSSIEGLNWNYWRQLTSVEGTIKANWNKGTRIQYEAALANHTFEVAAELNSSSIKEAVRNNLEGTSLEIISRFIYMRLEVI